MADDMQESLLICTLCELLKDDGRELQSCKHSFCFKCLRNFPLSKRAGELFINCPICALDSPVPMLGIFFLPSISKDLQEKIEKEKKRYSSEPQDEKNKFASDGSQSSFSFVCSPPVRIVDIPMIDLDESSDEFDSIFSSHNERTTNEKFSPDAFNSAVIVTEEETETTNEKQKSPGSLGSKSCKNEQKRLSNCDLLMNEEHSSSPEAQNEDYTFEEKIVPFVPNPPKEQEKHKSDVFPNVLSQSVVQSTNAKDNSSVSLVSKDIQTKSTQKEENGKQSDIQEIAYSTAGPVNPLNDFFSLSDSIQQKHLYCISFKKTAKDVRLTLSAHVETLWWGKITQKDILNAVKQLQSVYYPFYISKIELYTQYEGRNALTTSKVQITKGEYSSSFNEIISASTPRKIVAGLHENRDLIVSHFHPDDAIEPLEKKDKRIGEYSQWKRFFRPIKRKMKITDEEKCRKLAARNGSKDIEFTSSFHDSGRLVFFPIYYLTLRDEFYIVCGSTGKLIAPQASVVKKLKFW